MKICQKTRASRMELEHFDVLISQYSRNFAGTVHGAASLLCLFLYSIFRGFRHSDERRNKANAWFLQHCSWELRGVVMMALRF